MRSVVWSNTPDTANKLAQAVWNEHDLSTADCCQNINGKNTKKGDTYSGFACLGWGSSSLNVQVDSVVGAGGSSACHTFGVNQLKRILKSRGLCATGDKQKLAAALKAYLRCPPPTQQELEKSAAADAADATADAADAAAAPAAPAT
eukprot:COSAG01_NODE_733_length_13988_cov_1136.208150_11_plen_146_part_01